MTSTTTTTPPTTTHIIATPMADDDIHNNTKHNYLLRDRLLLPQFADTTTTIIYCIHCRTSLAASASASGCSSDDDDDDDEVEEAEAEEVKNSNTNTNTNINTNTKKLNRCSRCKVVHYCSKECQKLNYNFHKKRCKLISKLRESIAEKVVVVVEETETEEDAEVVEENEENEVNNQKQKQQLLSLHYELSYMIFEMAYMSTDTIERGKYIYQLSLLEYYKLLRIDFYSVGVLESILLLLSILNYNEYCISLIKYVLYNNNNNNNNNNESNESNESNSNNENESNNNSNNELCWDYGDIILLDHDSDSITTATTTSDFEISDYNKFRHLLSVRYHNSDDNNDDSESVSESESESESTTKFKCSNNYWSANILFVPLMIIKMRQYAEMNINMNTKLNTKLKLATLHNDNDNDEYELQLLNLKKEIAELCHQIEYETNTSESATDNNTNYDKLPVIRSLFLDSRHHWGEEEAQMLLAKKVKLTMTTTTTTATKLKNQNQNQIDHDNDVDIDNTYNEWEKCCLMYWMLIKDCYAYTPGLLDVVEEIILYMEQQQQQQQGINIIPENTHTSSDTSPSSDTDTDTDTDQSKEYISFINSMSSSAQEQQHDQEEGGG